MECTTVTVTEEGGIGRVLLDRADKRNAMSRDMIARIGTLLADPPAGWRVAVIAGQGPHFCAGLDLAEHRGRSPAEAMEVSRLWHRATSAIAMGRVPVITALHGAVIGAGLELASAAHLRIAARSARFSLPEARRGIFVGGGASVRVGRLIGTGRLTELMLTGRVIDAEEAHGIGLVERVVPDETLAEEAAALARDIADNAPLSNRMIINALAQIADMPQEAGLFAEALAVALTQSDTEAQARMSEFLDARRRPQAPQAEG